MSEPFEQIYRTAHAHGIYFGVNLPKDDVISQEIWKSLHPLEQKIARNLKGKRKISFVGGRVAARMALQTIQQDALAITQDSLGAPIIANPHSTLTLSISHKSDQAIALLNRQRHVTVGIDLEHFDPPRMGIASKVLTPIEQERMLALPEERRWLYLLMIFSFKEAVYKALAPRWRRYIGFEEAIVEPKTDMTASIRLQPQKNDILPKELDARYLWYGTSIITSVRILWQ